MILSTTSPSSTKLFTCSTAPRVSSSHSTSRIFYSVKSGCARKWSRRRSSLVFCASNPANKMKSSSRNTAAAAAVVDSASDQHEISPHETFLDARTEEELLLGIQKEVEAGRLPINVAQGMEELYHNYRNAAPPVFSALDVLALDKGGGYVHLKQPSVPLLVFQSGHPKSDEIVLSNMAVTLDRVFLDVRDPFQFSPYHEAIREPFDYYMFGQRYIRPLLDFRPAPKMAYGTDDIRGTLKRHAYHELWTTSNLLTPLIQTSFVGNISLFDEMEKKLEQGENVILISNHQTEADPAVIALLLESTNPFIAENIIFVAGDRVVTDPLCKPFSMGRNLLCVYSKNHMNDDPELIDMKKRANTKSLKEMALLLRGGSKIIWIAPSGGRDRPDPVTKEWFPAPFDASSVDNMRRLAEHAGVPGRVYPLAISCHDIMPPPAQVEKEIGERRVISFHGVGLSVAPSIDYHEVASALEDLEEAKLAYTESLYSSVCEQYNVLKSAIHGKQGLGASTPTVSLSQPWQ